MGESGAGHGQGSFRYALDTIQTQRCQVHHLCRHNVLTPRWLCGWAGVHECLVRSIMKADLDLRKNFFQHIVLAGGSTLFPGQCGATTTTRDAGLGDVGGVVVAEPYPPTCTCCPSGQGLETDY